MESLRSKMDEGEEILLRFAELSDCDDIFEWRNDPVSIAFSGTKTGVLYDNHVAWFTKKLEDHKTHILVVTNPSHKKIGVIRFDSKDQEAIISVNLNPSWRGKGYGTLSVKRALDIYFHNFSANSVIAHIMPKNTASKRLFSNLGFKHLGNLEDGQDVMVLDRDEFTKLK